MRGIEQDEEGMFSYISREKRVPLHHPLRAFKQIVRDVFNRMHAALLHHDDVLPLLSDEHFSVDVTLIDAWASHKSFKPKDGSGDGDGGKLPHVSNTPQDDGVRFWLG